MPPQEQNQTPTLPPAPQEPINPNPGLPVTSPVPAKKSNAGLWVVVAAVVLAIAGGVTYWFMSR